MLMITKTEYENTRICELENRYYNALCDKLAKRVGGGGYCLDDSPAVWHVHAQRV